MASLAAAATGAEIMNALPNLIDAGGRLSERQWSRWKEYQDRQASGRAWVYNKTNKGVTFYSYNNLSVIRATTNQQYYVGAGKFGGVSAAVQNSFTIYPDNKKPGFAVCAGDIIVYDGDFDNVTAKLAAGAV